MGSALEEESRCADLDLGTWGHVVMESGYGTCGRKTSHRLVQLVSYAGVGDELQRTT